MGKTTRTDRDKRRSLAAAVTPDERLAALIAKFPRRYREVMQMLPDPGSVECTQLVTRLVLAAIVVQGELVGAGKSRWVDFVSLLGRLTPSGVRSVRAQRDLFGEAATLGDVLVTRDDRIQVFETDDDGKVTTRDLTPDEVTEFRAKLFAPKPAPPEAVS